MLTRVYASRQMALEQLYEAFGTRFVGFLAVVYLGLKGLNLTLMSALMLPVFQSLGVSAMTFQLASVVSTTPWCLIGLIGVLSDCLPIGSYHSRGYLVIASVVGLIGNVALVSFDSLEINMKGQSTCWFYAALFFLTNWHYATFDTLAEGKVAEIMRCRGAGSEAMSFVWTCTSLGGVASGILVYFFIDDYRVHLLFALALPAAVVASILAARGYLPEQRVLKYTTKRRWAKFMSSPWLFLLAMTMTAGALMIAASAVVFSPEQQLMSSLFIILMLLVASFLALGRTLAKANLYMFISAAAYLDLSGVLGYFYTAGEGCVPDGPSFSYSYYLAVTGIVGTAAGCVGSLLFTNIKTWSFRSAFCLTTLIQVIAAGFDLVIIKRWNLQFGISDRAAYLFGDAACQHLAQMFAVMPGVLLISRLCPRGAESTVYAILSGFHNLGANIAGLLGVWLTGHLGIRTVGNVRTSTDCDFSGLSSAIVIAHFVLPILCLPLTFVLIPSGQMDNVDVFDLASPAPSFASPSASPLSSPRGSDRMSLDSGPPTPESLDSPWHSAVVYLPLAGGEEEKRSFVLSGWEAADFVKRSEASSGTH